MDEWTTAHPYLTFWLVIASLITLGIVVQLICRAAVKCAQGPRNG